MRKIPEINIKATNLIGALINEYDNKNHEEFIIFLNSVKILDCKNRKRPTMDWINFKTLKIINSKQEHKKQQIYNHKIDFSVI